VRSVVDRWSYYAADAGIPLKQTNEIGSAHLIDQDLHIVFPLQLLTLFFPVCRITQAAEVLRCFK